MLQIIELMAVVSCILHFGGPHSVALIAGIATIVLFRLASLHWNLRLPEANPGEH